MTTRAIQLSGAARVRRACAVAPLAVAILQLTAAPALALSFEVDDDCDASLDSGTFLAGRLIAGGGIRTFGSSELELERARVVDNTIRVSSTVEKTGGDIDQRITARGGGIANSGTSLTVDRSTIARNRILVESRTTTDGSNDATTEVRTEGGGIYTAR